MIKDYLEEDFSDKDEISFVERYWTEVWDREKGLLDGIGKIPNKPEYKVMYRYIKTMAKDIRILDGGCGLGNWTVYFSRQGFRVLGLDISKKVIARLQQLFPDVEFSVADIRNTGLPDDSFDIYFSWGVFEHFEQGMYPCIKEARRVLKPGGLLFITVPADNLRHAFLKTFKDYRDTGDIKNTRFYQWRFTRAELARELRMGGFEVELVKSIHKHQGVLRSLQNEFGLDYRWFISRALSALLAPFIPAPVIGHMNIAVARKPE